MSTAEEMTNKVKEEAEKVKAESKKETKEKILEKAKEIAKNLLEIGLTQEQDYLYNSLRNYHNTKKRVNLIRSILF